MTKTNLGCEMTIAAKKKYPDKFSLLLYSKHGQ